MERNKNQIEIDCTLDQVDCESNLDWIALDRIKTVIGIKQFYGNMLRLVLSKQPIDSNFVFLPRVTHVLLLLSVQFN